METGEFREKYNNWNIKKQEIQFSNADEKYFKERDIWWCSLGQNIGSESYGKGKNYRRPILILKKLSEDLCIALPLTSKKKTGTWFADIVLHDQSRCVMLYQIRTLNKKRFSIKLGEVDIAGFLEVKQKLEHLLKLSINRHSTGVEIERC